MPEPTQPVDMSEVIEDSLADAQQPLEDVSEEVEVSSPTESLEASPEASGEPTEPVVEDEVPSPTEKSKSKVFEDFDKKFGLDPQYPSGRENRIPYSRVKKIAQKAVRDARKEWEAELTPKQQEYETKVKSYEDRLSKVDQFERVMVNEPQKFLEMLSTIPAYQQFFQAVEEAFTRASQTGEPQQSQEVGDDMPQPDQQLSDGSMVYSMNGLKALLAWQANQVENRVTKQVESRYKPIESEWQAQQRINSLKPVVNAQIAEARTWKGFNENEAEIVEALRNDQRLSLEGAYRKIVLPKLEKAWEEERAKMVPDRNKMREELLAELKGAPRSTSVPAGSKSSISAPPSGPRSLEEVIAESIKSLK